MKKELYIYLFIFLLLSLLMHFEQWLDSPLNHLQNLENSGAYGIGFIHPFVFTFLIYIILLILRLIAKIFRKKS